MQGLMQQHPLSIIALMRHAALNHGDTEIVSCPVEEDAGTHRYGYADAFARMEKLASALSKLGVRQGDRVGTLAWNTWRHLELFYALPGLGAVCHTINPRLFEDQLVYIANHAEDRFLCLDITFVELVEKLADRLETIEGFIIMTDRAHMPETSLKNVHCYEDLLAAEDTGFEWPILDENSASSLCYTSGTTGNPKGVLYSHRSTVLHTYAACMPDAHAMSSTTTTMPVAPMFHANAWGIPYCAAAVGAKMVLPGRDVSGPTLHELILEEGVDHSVAVPTVWLDFLNHVEENALTAGPLKMTVIGGTAVPESMYRRFNRLGVEVRQGWGMTELSPLGTVGTAKHTMNDWDDEARFDQLLKAGRSLPGVEMRIVDDEGNELPRDGETTGHLQVRGHWVTSGYLKLDKPVIDNHHWFDTGDVANIDPHGFMQITDRSKDVIKSGGEWISSIDLENEAMGHPGVQEAAVIGAYHPKWDERPLLIVVPKGDGVAKEELLEHLRERIVKWWLPDDIVFVDELPHAATGKVQKTALRDQFKDYELPTASKAS